MFAPSKAASVAMGTTMSEPCIYDKLSESIDILRQSGYRYGMSEREIERFIKRMLETNEPRREPPQFPLLRATVKVGRSADTAFFLMYFVNSFKLSQDLLKFLLCCSTEMLLRCVVWFLCSCLLRWAFCFWERWHALTPRMSRIRAPPAQDLATGHRRSATCDCSLCPSPRSTICKVNTHTHTLVITDN